MEVLLEEGDVLYLPRGYIHQACTQDSNHSLHITVSVYQCNAWIDLLEKVRFQFMWTLVIVDNLFNLCYF